MKVKDIMYEVGDFWVLRSKLHKCYYVMCIKKCHSESDSAYSLDDDGLEIAIARCNYLNKRKLIS